ncbi:hypothetical protein BX616_005735 [Lobosporangium transversale]|uniref:Kinetochore Sim4 complex subunit Fta4 n=1 Tax=Lobosporangium transversale TaxID=64571 RepID=A0A1Y2G6M3_9FUNG|nr:kinetochore Sim4 complex subunit Fta4 [Lobosporangium transversale]KAF9915614.1 hypothetical protein BX616_005735 [Lobosporangium transversale]ORY98360.1 kinetochore Sim4 complex subunit Fta4 [Lobosporangium transversale]|eukprot:XP_021875752.1 kinetochore Sim4 complex subunit Fta4 [Lobosporangium transversale]
MSTSQSQTSLGHDRYYHDKKAFIAAQIRLLEAPIQPSPDWRRQRARLAAEEGSRATIPETVITAVLTKLHSTSKKYLRLTFNNQSIRQLLEQLERNQYELRKKTRQGGIIIRTKSTQELLNSDWIDMFPETWQQNNQVDNDPMSSLSYHNASSSSTRPLVATVNSSKLQKYADLRSRVVALQAKYQSLLDKHEYYKTLQSEIRCLDTGDMQRNMLAPNSQAVQELTKMKELLPRLISILESRRNVLIAKRKEQPLATNRDIDVIKRQRLQPTNPLDTIMEYLQN